MRATLSLCLAIVLGFIGATARATTITYDLTNVLGNRWSYEFTVANDSLTVPIDEFTIYFNLAAFSNLAAGSQPTGWDPLVAQPDPGLPADGFFDALALAGGIAQGASLGGFQVLVDFSGTSQPGAPSFDVFDPTNFKILDSGRARPLPPVNVPEPGVLMLLAAALFAAGISVMMHRRDIRNSSS